MFQNKGLASKISLFVLIGTIITFVVMIGINNNYSKNLLTQYLLSKERNLTYSAINSIETVSVSVQKITFNLALLLQYSDISEANLNSYIKNLVSNNPEVYACCVAYEPGMYPGYQLYAPYYYKKYGKIFYVDLPKNNYEYLFKDWYQVPKTLEKAMWSEPYFDEGAGNIVMSTYSVPFYTMINGRKVLKGIVAVDISLDWLQKFLLSFNIGSNGYISIISRKGTYISHPNTEYIMNETIFSSAVELNRADINELGRKMVRGETGVVYMKSQVYREGSWVFFSPIPSNDWSVGLVIPEKVLWHDLGQLNRFLIILGFFGIILLFLIVILGTQRFVKPLNELAASVDYIAKGNFDSDFIEIQSQDEIGILSRSFNNMRKALKSYMQNLVETTTAREKIDSELKIAHDIQMNIVPNELPILPNRSNLDIFALLEPARSVGGDWYDYFYTDNDHLCFTIGDVSGKGVPAAILMAVMRTYLRAKATSMLHVEDIMSAINLETAIHNDYMMFATIFIGILNVRNGLIYYCNASHNPPYILKTDGEIVKLSEIHGVAVGIFEDRKYTSGRYRIDPGEAIVLYTDGVTEAANEKEELFGYANLERILQKYVASDSKTIIENVRAEIKNFTHQEEEDDDITMQVIRYAGPVE